MNKSEFRGFKQVFLFEFMTGINKPGFKIFLAIMCVIAFFSTPVMIIIGNNKGEDEAADNAPQKSLIESVYIYNETGLSLDYGILNDSEQYADVSFITDSGFTYDDAVENLKNNSDHKNLVLKTEYDDKEGFDVTILHSGKSGIGDGTLKSFEDDYKEFLRGEILKNLGVDNDDYEYMSKEIDLSIMKTAKDGSFVEDTSKISSSDYSLMLGGLMAVFLFINMSASNVATSVATEKSSRVIEYLLTGTRPIALLSGKIVARLVETLITTFASYSAFVMSQIVCVFLLADGTASTGASSNVIAVASIWESITLSKIVVAVLYFLAGLALYAIIGALTGASVSKLDELPDAYKFYSILMVVCVYTDMALIIIMLNSSGLDAFRNFCVLFPLTGAFLTPALILTGKLSIFMGIIALALIVATVAIAFVLASAVYESMLLFQGKRLQAKDIIALMKKQVVA